MTATLPVHTDSHGHYESPATTGRRDKMGVSFLILADFVFLLSLIFSYFYLRALNTTGHWIPSDSHVAKGWQGWVVTLIAILSLLAYRSGLSGIRNGSQSMLVSGMSLALVLIVVDLGAQIWQWSNFPFVTTTGGYASAMIMLAGANCFHLGLTIFLGIGMFNRSRKGRYTKDDFSQVSLVGLWWTWIALSSVMVSVTALFTN
jgi:heme/copper-type cytochrome/quinol oxidase subunit 3